MVTWEQEDTQVACRFIVRGPCCTYSDPVKGVCVKCGSELPGPIECGHDREEHDEGGCFMCAESSAYHDEDWDEEHAYTLERQEAVR